jgi:hypothetical protein
MEGEVKKAHAARTARQVYGTMISPKRKSKRRGGQIYPKEFTRFEVAAIGVLTIHWAYLEHMLLIATAELVDKAKIAMPDEATSVSSERRIDAFRSVVKSCVKDDWTRNRFLGLANRISNIQNDRHKVTHGLWEWYPSKPRKLRVYSFRPPFTFSDNFDLPRLARICDRLGEINYELTYPPRKGLKKLVIAKEDMAYTSRQLLLEQTEDDPAQFGIEPPPPLPANLRAALSRASRRAGQ